MTNVDHITINEALFKYNSQDLLLMTPNPISYESYNNIKCTVSGDWPDYDHYCCNFNDETFFKPNVWNDIQQAILVDLPLHLSPVNIEAPGITVVGKDIYFDRTHDNQFFIPDDPDSLDRYYQDFKNLPYIKDNFRVNELLIGGHNDGVFGLLKPNVAMSILTAEQSEAIFPGWDVCNLPGESFHKVREFFLLRRKNAGSWWVPGQEENDEFTNFVQTWLGEWVGYIEESVFDVNVLVLDEHHVCVNNLNNPVVNAFLKKHKMEAIHVPWRHRFFWDGGLHCITLDLYREGKQQDYFPNRTEPFKQKRIDYTHYNSF